MFLGVRHAFGGAGTQDEPLRSSAWEAIRSAGDNDRRSKRFCSSAVLCVSFTWQMVKNARNQISSDKRSKNAWSNCVLCIPYILSGSPNECNKCWLHTCDVCVITTRPGLLEAWLALTSVKYHGNLYILIPLNQRLALTRLRATGPWRLGLRAPLVVPNKEFFFC